MPLKALDRKALRDLARMWSQALTIALVVASGVGGLLTTLSAVDSLAAARDRFYAEAAFADLFAAVKRAPAGAAARLAELPGVADVQTTVEATVRITLEGRSDPVVGQLIGVDPRRPARMNRVVLRRGRADAAALAPATDGALPAWVSETFAEAHGLVPGSRLAALVNGRQRTLLVAGVALSPEYVFAGLWGMPDQRGFGVFWVDHDALAAAYDLQGAFTNVAAKLAPGADARVAADAMRRALAPFGGRDVHGREHQGSHAMLQNEIDEQHVIGSVLPAIFFAVAAFLLNVVISRLVATQREQIAALKALGYANAAIGAHYLKIVLAIVVAGFALGVAAGDAMGTMLTGLYAEFFRFPRFEHRISPALVALAFAATFATAVAGTLAATLATLRLAPAEAMRPPAPARHRATWVERLGFTRLPTVLRMILRTMERRPWRTGLAIGGVAAAVAVVVMGSFFRDAIAFIVDAQFRLVMRNDVAVWTFEPLPERARLELLRLPGVKAVESLRFASVEFVAGHRRERGQIRGYATVPDLYRIVGSDLKAVLPAGEGLVLTDRLAAKLGVRPGDVLQAEVLEGRQRTLALTVDATVPEMMGLNAYMNRDALNRALGDGDLATGFALALEPGAEAALLDATRRMPKVAGAFSKASMLANMEAVSARNVRIMSTVLTAFAAVIAVGVVYNNARIALAERAWELASLRVLGFTRAEVSAVLLGEMAIGVALALPLGMLAGWGLVHAVAALLASDQFAFPVVIAPATYAWAAICIAAAAAASALVVRRRIDRLDLVAVLKTRD